MRVTMPGFLYAGALPGVVQDQARDGWARLLRSDDNRRPDRKTLALSVIPGRQPIGLVNYLFLV
jgi:hypothetical protein